MDDFLNSFEIAKRLGISIATVSQIAKECDLTIKRLSYHDRRYSLQEVRSALASRKGHNQFNTRFVSDSGTKNYDDFWKLDWDEFIVACDTHTPFIHAKTFNMMAEVANKYKIKNFIHAGDFWDQLQFSRFDVEPDDLTRFDKDILYTRKVMRSLIETFPEPHFFLGSHDVRFWMMMLKAGKAKEFDEIWGLLNTDRETLSDKIRLSKYRYCEIGEEWRINHPKNVVRIGGLPAVRLAAKHGRSIVFGHGHWWGQTADPSGKHYLIAPGCLCDAKKIAYKNIWDTSHDEWRNGFLVVMEKTKPFLVDENTSRFLFGIKR